MADNNTDTFAPPSKEELAMFAPPSPEELKSLSPQEPSLAGTIAAKTAQGATLGLVPKLSGIMNVLGYNLAGAGTDQVHSPNPEVEAKLQAIKQQMTPSTGDLYQSGKQDAQNYLNQASAARPIISGASELAGGLLTGGGMAKAGLGVAAEGASGLQKLGTAAQAGAGVGAAQEAATHDYSPSSSYISQLLKAAGHGAIVGGLTGGAIQGTANAVSAVKGNVGNFLNDTEAGQAFSTGKQMGQEGENLLRKSTGEKYTGMMQDEAQNLQNTLSDKTSSLGVKQENIIKALDDTVPPVELTNDLSDTQHTAMDLADKGVLSDDEAQALSDKLSNISTSMSPSELNTQIRALRDHLPDPAQFKQMSTKDRAEAQVISDLVKRMNSKLTGLSPELADTRSDLSKVLEVQGKDIGAPDYRLSGEKQPAPSLFSQIEGISKDFNPSQQQTYSNIKDVLQKVLPPEQSNQLIGSLEDLSQKYGVAKSTASRLETSTPYQLGHTAKAGSVIGNIVGMSQERLANMGDYFKNVGVQGAQSIGIDPQKAQKLGSMLQQISVSPVEKRSALLFAISQDKDYRRMIGGTLAGAIPGVNQVTDKLDTTEGGPPAPGAL